jgi:predicted ATPase
VAKLTAALSGVERAKAAARRALERLQRYRAAVLHAAVTGELTRAWHEGHRGTKVGKTETGDDLLQRLLAERRARWEEAELRRLRAAGKEPKDNKWKVRYPNPTPPKIGELPKLPQEWSWTNLSQLKVYSIYGPRFSRNDYAKDGVAVLRTTDINDRGLVSLEACPKLPLSHAEYEKYKVEAGDLLITRTGSIGTLAVFNDRVRAIPGAYLLHYRLVDNGVVQFVYTFLRSPAGQRQLWEAGAGSGRQNLSAPGLESIPIPLPPIAEQAEIIREVEHRLSKAYTLAATLDQQIERTGAARQGLLRDAFAGRLVPQHPGDEPASLLLERIRVENAEREAELKEAYRVRQRTRGSKGVAMKQTPPSIEILRTAWQKIGKETDARRLFDQAGFVAGEVVQFYEALRAIPELRAAFANASQESGERGALTTHPTGDHEQPGGRFRLVELWLEDFRNLKDYTVRFNPTQGVSVVLGWNGTGKSNLFEALVILFHDLHEWSENNRWPDEPMNGFRLSYEMDEHTVGITWEPRRMRRPELKRGPLSNEAEGEARLEPIKREQLPLPRFIFGYYSGPTNRLAEQFLPMKQAHYVRLREAVSDDAKSLAKLLGQRRFFCAETHHAKYVLLAFSYKEDSKMREFLKDRLRIVGFESALFVIREPPWAKSGSKAEDFWGAKGIMRRVVERLRRHAIAPMVLKQKVSHGYRSKTENHYYFFLPDLRSLHSFAAAYQDAQTFFMALESTDFSELIYDLRIQVRVKASSAEEVSITFHQLSEGEQQLLMVLGLMRFTKSRQSLVLLDEPDTHLNPLWSVDYLRDLARAMGDNAHGSTEQQTSQILVATHDPLIIASLVKEQVHLLKRDVETLKCYWELASEDPRGLGFTGILTSEMFGFRSDLDQETLGLLDKQVDLAGKEKLSQGEASELETITQRVEKLGFKSASSDPYYRAFIKAVVRRQRVRDLLLKPTLTKPDIDVLHRETTDILAEIEAEEAKAK